jgi:exocyst complex component 7
LQVRTHAIRMAHENIDRTIKAADGILNQFDLARRVGVLADPLLKR